MNPNSPWGTTPYTNPQNPQAKPTELASQSIQHPLPPNNTNAYMPVQFAAPAQSYFQQHQQQGSTLQQQNTGQTAQQQGQPEQQLTQQQQYPGMAAPFGSMIYPTASPSYFPPSYPGMPHFPMPMSMPMGGYGAYPPTTGFPSITPPPFLPPSPVVNDTAKLQEKDKTIVRLSDEINELKNSIEEKNYEFEKTKKKLIQKAQEDCEELNREISELKSKINELENKISQLLRQNQNLYQQSAKEKEEYAKQISELEQILDDQKWQIQNLEQQLPQNKKQNPIIISGNINSDQTDKLKRELDLAKRQITVLEKQHQELKNNSQKQIDNQIFELQQELEKLEIARKEFIRENENLRRQVQKYKQETNISNDSIFSLQNQLREISNKLKQEQKNNEELLNNIKARDTQIEELDQLFKKQAEQPQGRPDAVDIQLELKKQYDQLQVRKQQQQEFERLQEEIKKQALIDEQIRREQKQKDQVLFDIQEKEKKRNQAKLIKERMLQSHGQMDVCFLVDVTGSMDSYKLQTKQCIKGSMTEIKELTNRDTNFACVCYQDFAELKKKQQYEQFDFTKNPPELENWLEKVKCEGGGDTAEDIRGGMLQMCNKLKWSSKFKIAILICDAPCHGEKYHESNVSDNHPADDIADAIIQMIKQEILFIGLNFKSYTTKMYQKIKQIFVEQKREELFMLVDMQNTPLQQVAQQMVKQIGEASQSATQTNNNSTKSKQQAQDQKQAKDGAMEALCKQGNFLQFETQVKTVDAKFIVFRTEIKADALERNLKIIQNIQTPQDYQIIKEGQWDCIRTEKPFAYGMMKAVFLMKKKSNLQGELYVIKTPLSGRPYRTMDEALKECKSHLICQQLMKRFYKDLNEQIQKKKIGKKFTEVVYSDFLILQENDSAFWIAERFFKGEFVKYNNNFGFISASEDELNRIAQAFTYYTYFVSDFNYMINDVQGVSTYFTDPAVNTKTGDFDDTDMGENGQAMYIANFSEQKQMLCQEILQILDIIEKK